MVTAVAYARQLAALLPRGAAWATAPGSVMGRLLEAIGETFARVHQRGLQLVVESDPRTTVELLEDWERVTNLPDPCAGVSPTLEQRRNQVVARLRGLDDVGEEGFRSFAADLGFTTTITTLQPFRCGESRCGDPLGSEEWAHVWLVTHSGGDIAVLQCEFEALKPAHTVVLFEEGHGGELLLTEDGLMLLTEDGHPLETD